MTDTDDQVTCAMCKKRFSLGAPGSAVRVYDHGEGHYCAMCWTGTGQKSGQNKFSWHLIFLVVLAFIIIVALST